jgi:hypothetical protein
LLLLKDDEGDTLLYQSLLKDPTFFSLLFQFDQDLAEKTRTKGCRCSGRLDVANYWRKPRGGPEGLSAAFDLRLSFCCATDGCRKRATPPSVRFLGRRVYFMPIFVLVTAMGRGVSRKREAKLRAFFGASRRTLERWRRWWREAFPTTRFWRDATGRLSPPVNLEALPRSLLERFTGPDEPTRVLFALAFLAPLGVTFS